MAKLAARYEAWCFDLPVLLGFFLAVLLPVMVYLTLGVLIVSALDLVL